MDRKKGKESLSVKDSTSYSYKSQLGECQSYWLLRGPPFDQRDYMISPSDSPCGSVAERILESPKVQKKKLGPSDIKIDSKYHIDSQKALKKIAELIKDGTAEQLVDRIEDLIRIFLQGSPLGFMVDDLPWVIEIVEYFSRNMTVVPKFSEFVKTIMEYASEPPKVGRPSKTLAFRETLVDYFTLFGSVVAYVEKNSRWFTLFAFPAELLATFEDECFQLQLLEALDCLIIRRKLVDVCCVKLSFCHEAMEDSQLPCVVAALMETVSNSLYLNYLELALQMIWVSVKAGYLMVQIGVLEYVIWRMDPTSSGNAEEFPMELLEGECNLDAYYRLIDKSAYLIWCFFAIVSKYNVEIPVPKERALWSLKYILHREIKKKSSKAPQVRNNLAGILTKLYALMDEKLAMQKTGLLGDIAAMSVATEIKSKNGWLADVHLGTTNEDFLLKKLMLLCCCLFSRDKDSLWNLEKQEVIEGILRLINPKTTLPWIPSQFLSLLLVGLRSLSELVPKLPEVYLNCNGNHRLLNTIKWITEEHFDQDPLLEALKTFCCIISCENEAIIKDAKGQGGLRVLIDICFRLLNVTFMKLEHQDKLSRIFLSLDRLLKNDRKLQAKFSLSCSSISVKFLQRVLADSENDSKWNSNVLVSFGGFLWETVAWCSSALKAFDESSGIFLLLDFIESRPFPLQLLFLGVLVDMTDEGETIAHLLIWRGKNGSGILSLLIDIWRKEEFLNKVHRTKDGVIEDEEAPLMTEEQWYFTHQVIGGHIYSPSIAEMAISVRPKIHALYQFLQRRYFQLTQIGESNYSLHLKMIPAPDQVYIPLIEHYLALKMGEIWWEVIHDSFKSGVLPSSFDGHVICTLLDEKNKWACRIKTLQEEILLANLSGAAGEEKQLYLYLKTCQLPSALEAMRELDYIARTSYKKFQKMKKRKQILQIENSYNTTQIALDDFCHRTFLKNTNVTYMRAESVFLQSQKLQAEVPVLVSPMSSEECLWKYKEFSS